MRQASETQGAGGEPENYSMQKLSVIRGKHLSLPLQRAPRTSVPRSPACRSGCSGRQSVRDGREKDFQPDDGPSKG